MRWSAVVYSIEEDKGILCLDPDTKKTSFSFRYNVFRKTAE